MEGKSLNIAVNGSDLPGIERRAAELGIPVEVYLTALMLGYDSQPEQVQDKD